MARENEDHGRAAMPVCDTRLPSDAEARDRRLTSLVAALREASRALDELWRDAVTGDADRLVELGDASHGVHIALVALEDGEADRRARLA